MLAWHFTDEDKLRNGRPVPPIGETLKHRGPLKLCISGLHASKLLLDALHHAPGTVLHRVECSGSALEADDKLVCSERTILASADMRWALVEFAEDCAKRAKNAHAARQAAHAARHAAYNAAAVAVASYYAAEVAVASYYAAAIADAEREHQNSTLELWFECMKTPQ